MLESNAIISACGRYRYALMRSPMNALACNPPALFVMLNPSTADATEDDPTIRRCRGFAKAWNCSGLIVVNLYALRATQPAELWTHPDPVGPDNDDWLRRFATRDALVICAWGANARADRVAAAATILTGAGAQLHCLGTTKAGAPRHPLYIRADQVPVPYELPELVEKQS